MRRILRIWPIYYAYIAICAVVFMVAGISDSIYNDKLWYYLLFFANTPFISATFIPIIGHFWSIGVEEQFYLFWPCYKICEIPFVNYYYCWRILGLG